jgi:hypothetical protein
MVRLGCSVLIPQSFQYEPTNKESIFKLLNVGRKIPTHAEKKWKKESNVGVALYCQINGIHVNSYQNFLPGTRYIHTTRSSFF